MRDSTALRLVMQLRRETLSLVAFTAFACLSGCSPARPSAPFKATIEIQGAHGATGIGQVNVYAPIFGVALIGTCPVSPGSSSCQVPVNQNGTVDLAAAGVPGNNFTAWGGECASATGTICRLTINSSRSFLVTVAFSRPTS